jgi:hypothetical protein
LGSRPFITAEFKKPVLRRSEDGDLERRIERMEQLWLDYFENMGGLDRTAAIEIGIQAIFHEMVQRGQKAGPGKPRDESPGGG